MAMEWAVEIDGKQQTQLGSRIHVAVHRALVQHYAMDGFSPLPPVDQVVVIRAWRTGRKVLGHKRRGY